MNLLRDEMTVTGSVRETCLKCLQHSAVVWKSWVPDAVRGGCEHRSIPWSRASQRHGIAAGSYMLLLQRIQKSGSKQVP